ncbi:hypothetical protein BC939DRAFT_441694 [Gamsiella multidivaricata]|uniref:uncharacterized protein n=1 Tax=Gamsiella multidivaricata TaxID=101098 RepID=UPI0022211E85|nr:uncharacterized protein BC939DRAFT_441694 [Gamsiella multidivaricata]KAI7829371.1 hypothetical protein BC939DRAFT_441694 [Gamsiella multidivaricata]
MFTGLIKRAGAPPISVLKSALRDRRIAHFVRPVVFVGTVRHQSSSSSSRDNDNSNNADMEPITTNEAPVNASFELHRVDLAHGSFFALHRPLLGITNGPMFTSNSSNLMNEEDYEDPVYDLANYFSTLQPYSPPTSLSQSALVTPTATAWASLPPSLTDANQTIDAFLRMADKQGQEGQLSHMEEDTEASTSGESIAAISATAESIMDPSLSHAGVMYMTSVLRKRRIKMRKHKYKKLRKRTRALRKKLGK